MDLQGRTSRVGTTGLDLHGRTSRDRGDTLTVNTDLSGDGPHVAGGDEGAGPPGVGMGGVLYLLLQICLEMDPMWLVTTNG